MDQDSHLSKLLRTRRLELIAWTTDKLFSTPIRKTTPTGIRSKAGVDL
jgi:hypothetical protein